MPGGLAGDLTADLAGDVAGRSGRSLAILVTNFRPR